MSEQKQDGVTIVTIVVLGLANAGKSTFIDWVFEAIGNPTADHEPRVSIRTGRSTEIIQVEEVVLDVGDPTRKVVLVNTPGLGHTDMSDANVLKAVAEWMQTSYMRGTKVHAIIYVQDISHSAQRRTSLMQLDLDILVKLCGSAAIDGGLVTIATIVPGTISARDVWKRERELRDDVWSKIIGNCRAKTILDAKAAGHFAMDLIYESPAIDGPVLIQHELCVLNVPWFETSAGRWLRLPPDLPTSGGRAGNSQVFTPSTERENPLGIVPEESCTESSGPRTRLKDKAVDPNQLSRQQGTQARRELAEDDLCFKGRSSDVVLFIVGGQGAGKSTFINYVLDEVSHPSGIRMKADPGTLCPCTREVTPIRLIPSERNSELGQTVLVDGPGFDEDPPAARHRQIISTFSHWFRQHYRTCADMPKRGIIYIQDISGKPSTVDNRSLWAAIRLAHAIKGGDVSLVSMKWGKREPKTDQEAEQLFKEQNFKSAEQAQVRISKVEHCRERRCALAIVSESVNRTDDQRKLELELLLSQLQPSVLRTMLLGGPECSQACPTVDTENDGVAQKAAALRRHDVHKGDIIIVVVGQIKAGKTTFVNNLVVEDETKREAIEDQMVSHASEQRVVALDRAPIEHYALLNKYLDHRWIMLVETPGFNDSVISDDVVLSNISQWLEASCKEGMQLGGMIYLRDITQVEWTRRDTRGLASVLKKSGEDAVNCLVTTKWGRLIHPKDGAERVKELVDQHWKSAIDQGASVFHVQPCDNSPLQLEGTVSSSWDIVERMVFSMDPLQVANRILRIQHDLAKKKYTPPEPDVGRDMNTNIRNLLKAALQPKSGEGSQSADAQALLEACLNKVTRLNQQLAELEEKLYQQPGDLEHAFAQPKTRRDRGLAKGK